uniref:Uncharacterized protein n=1 Tax=Picea glauca TaxID=3330 RepID=A0A101LU08_PICGL|nr:hypothetical protein ABT39_MTgene3397 [Picea glauca]
MQELLLGCCLMVSRLWKAAVVTGFLVLFDRKYAASSHKG